MSTATSKDQTMPIAVVGMACRLPGGADNPSKVWDMLAQKRSARTDTPPSRFNIDAFYHPQGSRNGCVNNRTSHFLSQDISAFDAPFFSVSRAEAISMDPMQRLLLEVAYEAACESAGTPLHHLAGSDAGCFVGCFTQDYDEMAKRDAETLPKYHSIGTGKSILSNRISFCLDLRGPSVTLDTACSSGLVALHLACQSLRAGECGSALVGAANLLLSPDIAVGMTNLGFLSPEGISHAFDSRADGYARGEGVAALVLKPLDGALRDGDVVRCVIRGTAVNSNGRRTAGGITLPSREAQTSLIREAYRQAGLLEGEEMARTAYVEAHGTGTAAGDPVEARAVGEVLGRAKGREGKLYIGSIKTNVGHLEGASGLAGLIKAILSIEAAVILPNIWFDKGNPEIDFDGLNIKVPTELAPWPVPGLRRASVNGFGYGGTNSHVIIDDAYHYLSSRGLQGNHKTRIRVPDSDYTNFLLANNNIATQVNGHAHDNTSQTRLWLFPLSASDPTALTNGSSSLARYIESAHQAGRTGHDFLDELSYTLNNRRSKLEYRRGIVAGTENELIAKLDEFEQTTTAPSRVIKDATVTPKIAFIFTGQGAQWWGMGRELVVSHPVFRATLDRCAEAVQNLGPPWDLLDELLKDEAESEVNRAPISQPLCTALQIALVDLLGSWGVRPWRVAGHSSGEIAAAYATGALSLEAAMEVAYFRGLLAPEIRKLGYKGSMLAVGLSEEETLREIEALGGEEVKGKACVACVNSPRSTTVSGDTAALTELQTALTARGVFARKLMVDTAYHSHHMLAIAEEYKSRLGHLAGTASDSAWTADRQAHISDMFFSSVKGRRLLPGELLDDDYWVENMVSPVRFYDAVAALCTTRSDNGNKTHDENSNKTNLLLVELGPHAALAGPIKQILAQNIPSSSSSISTGSSNSIQYHSAITRGKDASRTAHELAALLFEQGYSSLSMYPPSAQSNPRSFLTDLPPYAWNHTPGSRTYWSESRISRDYRLRRAPRTDLLGAPASDWNPLEPRWRGFVRLAEQPWVADHVVQGATLYPAAGFVCMALEAARSLLVRNGTTETGPGSVVMKEYRIRELSISRALVVPQDADGVEVILSMRPAPTSSVASSSDGGAWNEFCIFSYTASNTDTNTTSTSDGGTWTEHCRGFVLVGVISGENDRAETINLDSGYPMTLAQEAQGTCSRSVDVGKLYDALDAIGLSYGPTFQSIKSLLAPEHGSRADQMAMGTLEVSDTARGMPKGFEFPRLVHPSTMDAMLQMGIVALCRGDVTAGLEQAYVPTFIKEITVSSDIDASAGRRFSAAAKAQMHGFRDVLASVTVLEQDRFTPVIRMEGVRCRAIASSPGAGSFRGERNIYHDHVGKVLWEPEVDLLELEQLNGILRKPLGGDTEQGATRIRDLEFLAYSFMHAALEEVAASGLDKSDMQDHHVQFFEYMKTQVALVEANQHEQQTPDWSRLGDAGVQDRLARLKKSLSSPEDYEGRMILRMGQALPRVLRQEIDPLTLMMEDGLLHDYYRVGLGVKQSYPQVAEYIKMLSHKNPNLEYLEIGAGTGGCTAPVLDALSGCGGAIDKYKYPRLKSYLYTDISAGFFDKAEAWLRPEWGHLVQFKKLNIEEDPVPQGFGEVDVIIAANVLHATKDIHRTLANSRKLLRPGGKLVVLDMAHKLLSVSLIFGNLSGWWLSEEDWRKDGLSPLLSEDQWQTVLRASGFSDLQASSPDFLDPLEEGTRVLIATAVEPTTAAVTTNGIVNGEKHETANGSLSPVAHTTLPQRYLAILHSDEPSAAEKTAIQALEATLTETSVNAKVFSLNEIVQEVTTTETTRTIISFLELDKPWLQDVSESDFSRLKHLFQTASGGILWVARGASSTRPELSLFQGLARSLRAEDESGRFVTVDLSGLPPSEYNDNHAVADAATIVKLYAQIFVEKRQPSDSEFVEKDGMLWIKRLVPDHKTNQRVAQRTRKITPAPEVWDIVGRQQQHQEKQEEKRTLKLQAETIGTIDSLLFAEQEEPAAQQDLAPDEVEIEVKAVGLNFRDVLITLGEVVDDYLGNECSGIITRMHSSVKSSQLAVGDRVAAWCLGSFATHVRCPAACVRRIPHHNMSFPVAASLPLAYVTAYHSLVNVARLRPGESVLVHAGAGGVGQAAIQVALMCGAEVYATVGSDQKAEFLAKTYGIKPERVFNSRDLSFVREVRRATHGRGVDVVLNSLAGNALREAWTRALAPFGRFIELGKRDIDVNGRLDMAPFAQNAVFAAVDVTHLWRELPALAGEILQNVMDRVGEGLLGPVQPVLVEPFSRVREAFRLMQSGRHIGKIVLEFREGDLCHVVPRPLDPVSFRPDATYLLAGGLGGLGRSISRWMVQRGARNLVYVSRGGTSSSDAAEQLITELNQQANVRTVVLQCDVTDAQKLSAALGAALKTLPPLRGVIQAAMVLNDATFANMSHSSFTSTVRPKVQGSWALHQATLEHHTVDFFIMLSSAAAFVGNAGQANYVAGCTYQGALAKHRRHHLGLPATAIDIGKVAGVGFVAESAGTVSDANLTRLGMPDISEKELLAMLELAIMNDSTVQGGDDGEDEAEHMVTGVIEITKQHAGSDSNTPPASYDSEAPFWARDPVFSHLQYARPQGLQKAGTPNDDPLAATNQTTDSSGPTITQIFAKLPRSVSTTDKTTQPNKPSNIRPDAAEEDTWQAAQSQILAALSRRLARALMIPANEAIDTAKSPANLGADSLVAIEIRNWVAREGGIEVPVFDIMQAPSLAALAGRVLKIARAKMERG
ncbi:hypothetical protein CONLIGDRAFT_715584 [Coniochaeta ligniaria NRRL 30616]|uniref:Uncharacterized protein n=1 Tax=Coniochaeta ligniaria NRRL 30616 TaxID=1408157 RepID=A0A1J7JNA4_9PEZI|nr:hypothetical protein CONLIGDRAFT_715584 [Coniochaeta ligniaria NRRL 30616]